MLSHATQSLKPPGQMLSLAKQVHQSLFAIDKYMTYRLCVSIGSGQGAQLHATMLLPGAICGQGALPCPVPCHWCRNLGGEGMPPPMPLPSSRSCDVAAALVAPKVKLYTSTLVKGEREVLY